MAPHQPGEYTTDENGRPAPNLVEQRYGRDAAFYETILAAVRRAPDNQAKMQILAENVPGIALVAACIASKEQVEEERRLNRIILDRRPHVHPGISSGLARQSFPCYPDVFEYFLANSPVLTTDDIRKAQNFPVFGTAMAYLFELLKETSEGDPTEIHYVPMLVGKDQRFFLEGVWNLHSIPKADSNAVAELYGAIAHYKKMPFPDTAFGRMHSNGERTIGPEDQTLGGLYTDEKDTYAFRSEAVFRWNRVVKKRPFWRVRNVFQIGVVSEQVHRRFAGVASLPEVARAKGSVLSGGDHYVNNGCLSLAIELLFPDRADLRNLPSHKIMLMLGQLSEKIWLTHAMGVSMDDFLAQMNGKSGPFAASNLETYHGQIHATLMSKTLRESHHGQPTFIETYCANHLGKEEIPALRNLLDLTNVARLQALMDMAR